MTSKDGLCAIHRAEANKAYNDDRRPRHHALYGSLRWKRMRLAHLTRDPFCARCGQFATIAHHKVEPKGDATLFYNPDNLESLCVACHNKQHANVSTVGDGRQQNLSSK